MSVKDDGTLRTFKTGATRDTGKDKLEPHGFLSPEALHRFSEYMHKHRKQSDGSLRDPDNWKKGMPQEEYVKSLLRHAMDFWAVLEGQGNPLYDTAESDPEEIACAIMFNVQGWLHENLKRGKKTSILCQSCGDPIRAVSEYDGRYYFCSQACAERWLCASA